MVIFKTISIDFGFVSSLDQEMVAYGTNIATFNLIQLKILI